MTEDDIKAKYENGVLSLMIPQKEPPKGLEKKKILIEGLTHAASPQSGSYEPDCGLVFVLALGSAFQ